MKQGPGETRVGMMVPEGWVHGAGSMGLAGPASAGPEEMGLPLGTDEIFLLLFCLGVFVAVLVLFLDSFQLL